MGRRTVIRSISQNVIFGALKSALTYAFIVAFYAIAHEELINHYIEYEIGLALSILLTLGIQSRSYKLVDFRGLILLGLVFISIAAPATIYCVGSGGTLSAVVALVLLDRVADIALQSLRQQGRFVAYNIIDLGNQALTKLGFLMAALDHNLLPWIAVTKIGAGIWWLLLQLWTERANSTALRRKPLWVWADLKPYFGFDIVNYSSGNIDLVVVKAFAPTELLLAYFYVRKFFRLPLTLINYVLDPAFIGIRAINDRELQLVEIRRLWRFFSWSMCSFALLMVPTLAWASNDTLVPPMAFVFFATAVFYIGPRMTDFVALLYWPQRRRTLVRSISVATSTTILCMAVGSGAWVESIALMPLVTCLVVELTWFKLRTWEAAPAAIMGCLCLFIAIASWPSGSPYPVWILAAAAVVISAATVWLSLRQASLFIARLRSE